ncbi:DNA-binding protein [Zhongshania aliphaticivorans]|uniref:DNA-binding protein n=1 Tax=Zhongshania aliphaticivorans TaxID=1470434 RepID=UPI0012E5DEF3|nr:DNA-binding protein [Zhongshania aliphaticivorans]CAA0103247.1 Uncharacterised protein [Zhongshania aliphaticivorans]
MSKEWFAATELVGLPGLPGTTQGLSLAAKRNDWKARARAARGGGKEYHLSSLPEATRNHILRMAVASTTVPAVRKPVKPADERRIEELTAQQREVMNARLAVCAMIDEIAMTFDVKNRQAILQLIELANSGELSDERLALLTLANAKKGSRKIAIPNRATLYAWLRDRNKGAVSTAPKTRAPAPQPVWVAPLLRLFQVEMPNSSITECVRSWNDYYPDITAPSKRHAQRKIQELPTEVAQWGRRGRNALRSVQPFVRRSTDGLWPMDVVTVDGHLFKAYVKNPMNSRLKIRPEITTYVDVGTRKAIGFSCWLAESQVAIWSALRDMVLNPECGVPAIHYSDNGAYRGDMHRAVMGRIGSQMCFSQAYRAQSRGLIERLNSSVWVPLARTFDTYVNDDSDEERTRKALKLANKTGENLMEWTDFLDCARKALEEYNDRSHGSLPGKISPNQAWANAVNEGWKPTVLEGDGLYDILFQEVRKVDRGEVTLPWGRYFHDKLRSYHGQKVAVCIHPTAGDRVAIMDSEERLICVAERDGNVVPYMSASMVNHSRLNREAAAIKRKERDIANYRLEAASARDIPTADIAALSPGLTHKPTTHIDAPDSDEENQERSALFNSYVADYHKNFLADSLDMVNVRGREND